MLYTAHVTTRYTSFSDVKSLAPGSIFACPTDTVYGLSCRAEDPAAVIKLKDVKGKGAAMPVIVCIGSLEQLDMFVPRDNESRRHAEERLLSRVWPGAVSVVFRDTLQMWQGLSPDDTLALRMPARDDFCEFLNRVGPLVSTSANHAGHPPATSAAEVMRYFPSELDFVIDTGLCSNPPSTLIKILR